MLLNFLVRLPRAAVQTSPSWVRRAAGLLPPRRDWTDSIALRRSFHVLKLFSANTAASLQLVDEQLELVGIDLSLF